MNNKSIYYLWLSGIRGVGPKTARFLLEAFQTPEALWHASKQQLAAYSKLSAQVIENIISCRNLDKLYEKEENIRRKNIKYVTLGDKYYPALLRHIYDPPVVLYYKGRLPLKNELCISVIGTRRCSDYGRQSAHTIAKQLAENGVNIISGMARGIDSIAHKAALSGNGKTTAVLGSGLDICYPPENRQLMQEIEQKGCVLSEYPPGTQPNPGNFPMRNRIISGLSHGVLVVEAGKKSGTLITVDQALEQGRDIYAVPGNVTSDRSSGTNDLIRQGAAMVTSAQDILDDFGQYDQHALDEHIKYQENITAALEPDEKNVYSLINEEAVHADQIILKSGLSVQTVQYILTALELRDLVKQLPGNRYIRQLS